MEVHSSIVLIGKKNSNKEPKGPSRKECSAELWHMSAMESDAAISKNKRDVLTMIPETLAELLFRTLKEV